MESRSYNPEFPVIASKHCSDKVSIVVLRGDDPKAQAGSYSARHYQIRLTAKVAGEACIGDYRGECRPGSLFLLGPNLPFTWSGSNLAGDDIGDPGWLVSFSTTWFQRMIQLMPELSALSSFLPQARQGLQFSGQTLQRAQQLLAAVVVANGAERVMLFLQLLECLSGSDESRSLASKNYAPLSGAKRQARIEGVVDFLSQHFDQDLSLGSVASRHGMSAGYLSRLFKQATGRGFCDFLTDLRIGHACELLSVSDQPITEICFDTGFKNISNFNRRFVALKQITPTEYRRAH